MSKKSKLKILGKVLTYSSLILFGIILPGLITLLTINNFPRTSFNYVHKVDGRKYTLLKFLERYGSPIAEKKYVDIIVDVSDANKADYRLNVGIMTAESGICDSPIKGYNCFGFMNGKRYANYEVALTDLVGKVSRQYTSRYGWNVEAMGKSYGAHNPTVWGKNVRATANKL